ncbi:Imm53 family immunity protein [Streptomyces sp. NPDC127119]|uniref:Imm53 family immunity protein n=1 Tax=Streptomyces sp. NPDC127119 TaxID=3345370 RepID=UPI003636D26B
MPSGGSPLRSTTSYQCDGDWEHEWGVKIGALDNPGGPSASTWRGPAWKHATTLVTDAS